MDVHQKTNCKTLKKIRVVDNFSRSDVSKSAFSGPVAVCIVRNEILLADSCNRMIVLDQWGTLMRTFGNYSKFKYGGQCIIQISANKTGLFIVVTTKLSRIIKHKVFNYLDGKFWFEFGKTKRKICYGIAIDKEDRILSMNSGDHLVLFNKNGAKIKRINCNRVGRPFGIAVSDEEQIFIGDLGNHSVQVYNYDGDHLKCIGQNLIPSPFHVGITSRGDVLVLQALDGELVVTLIGQYGALKSNSLAAELNVEEMKFALMPNDDLVVVTKSNGLIFYQQPEQQVDLPSSVSGQREQEVNLHPSVLVEPEERLNLHPSVLVKPEERLDLRSSVLEEEEQQLDLHLLVLEQLEQVFDMNASFSEQPEQQVDPQKRQLLDLDTGPLAASLQAPDHFEDVQDLSDHPLNTPSTKFAWQNRASSASSEDALTKFRKEVLNHSRHHMKLARQLIYSGRLCAVAVDSRNRVIVVSADSKLVGVFDSVGPGLFFGDSTSGFGELVNPRKVAADPQNCSIVVLDCDKVPSMKIFDQNGMYQTSFICSLVDNPITMSVTKMSKVAVLQPSEHQVVMFNMTGMLMEVIKCSNLKSPTGIAIDNDQVFISDSSDSCVKEYNLSGDLVRFFSDVDLTPSPVGVAIASNGHFAVLDAMVDFRMTFFNPSGIFAAGYKTDHRHVNVEGFALTSNDDVLLLCDDGKLFYYSTHWSPQAASSS